MLFSEKSSALKYSNVSIKAPTHLDREEKLYVSDDSDHILRIAASSSQRRSVPLWLQEAPLRHLRSHSSTIYVVV